MVMSFGRMSEPLTKVQKVDSTATAKSYNFAYKYEDSNHPTAPTQIGHDHYTYDANGNPTLVTNDSTNTTREMYWDEDNRLMVLSDNGKTSRYTYNAAGERIMKSYGTMEGVYINEPTLKSKACFKYLYFTKIISDLCCYLEYFSYLYTINQTE